MSALSTILLGILFVVQLVSIMACGFVIYSAYRYSARFHFDKTKRVLFGWLRIRHVALAYMAAILLVSTCSMIGIFYY